MRSSLKLAIPSLAIVFALMLCVTDVMAQSGGRGGRQRGGRDGGGGDDNPQRLLRSEGVQRDLELSEEQVKLLEGLNEGRGGDRGGDREAREAELEGLSEEARNERLREMRDARTRERMAEINDILLPHQMERLSQIAAQASAQRGSRSLINGSLAEKLEITDEQKVRIEEKAEELQKVFDEKIAKLRNQMQEQLLAELTPEQRDQYKEMMGEAFTFERQQRGGDRGAGGGDRGGDRGARVREQMKAAAIWPNSELPADFGDPVKSDVPTLILSGTIDPVTPPKWGEMIRKNFPNSLHLIVSGAHDIGGSCVDQIRRQFLETGTVKGLNVDCIAKMKLRPLASPK